MDRVQVVTNVGGLQDIFAPFPIMLVDPAVVITVPNKQDDHNGDAHICRAEDFADRLLYLYRNPEERAELERKVGEHVRSTYRWDTFLPEFCDKIQEIGVVLNRDVASTKPE
jgi:Glycosyltransferase